jgi:hypothetical protein
MMRALAIVLLLSFVCLFLYLPAVQPADHWMKRLHVELQLHARAWGRGHAQRVLDDAIRRSAGLRRATPSLQEPQDRASGSPVDAAMATQMNATAARLTDSAYLRSIEMLVTLAAFRVSALLSVLPWLMGIGLAAVVDGLVRRRIKSREFLQHHPEAFAAGLCGMLLTLGVTAITSILPVVVHPMFELAMPLAFAMSARLAIANYHARA